MVDEDSHSTEWRSFNNFISSLQSFGFNGGQRYLATSVTLQNCTKMLTFVVQSDRKRFCFYEQLSLQKATFDGFFEQLLGNFLENLEQLVESPNKVRDLK